MMRKKLFSALLAAAMVFGLLCTPAFAAGKADTLADINKDDSIWVGVTNKGALTKPHTFKVREWGYEDDDTITKGEAGEEFSINVVELPLGVTLAAGSSNQFLENIWAYSDPDGDGIFDERLEKITYDEDGEYVSSEIIPADAASPLSDTETEIHYNAFDWSYGENSFGANMRDLPGYRTLTTDYLVEKFGANTLMLFWDDEENYFAFLLTGKAAQAGVVKSLEDQGVFFSVNGNAISGWAVEPVNTAIEKGVYSGDVAQSHNYDLTGSITRGEFATIAMYLYGAMANTNDFTRPVESPFVDVDESTPNFKYILGAYELGIVEGNSTTAKTFGPDQLVSRQDAALMLSRVYEIVGGEIPKGASTTFTDNDKIGSWAMDAVAFMSSKGIINGMGGNRFDPRGNASVEQALKIAVEMMDKLDA